MLISKKWLSEFVDLPNAVSDTDIAARISSAVVEVEGWTNQAASFHHMVIGQVLSVTKHPNADRLHICRVDVGHEVQIVCGGTNVVEGMKVAVALPGARVRWHGEGGLIELEKTSIRGEESEGMICAGAEIGMGKPSDQEREILDLSSMETAPGTPLATLFGGDDVIFEIEHKSITHRPDLFGHEGMARELSALYRVPFTPYRMKKIREGKSINLSLNMEDETACPRYMAVAMDQVHVEPSPNWLVQRLESCGIRSINNIVDVTNFVLLELGAPMHAFDADKIGGDSIQIVVRGAHKKETLEALDEKTYELDHERLLITDGKHPIAIAGVMGGKHSAVNDQTTRMVFESANFSAESIRKTSQVLSLRSESSTRYEKSLDPTLCERALSRAVELVLQLCPDAHVASAVVDTQSKQKEPCVLHLSPLRANAFLGTDIPDTEMKDILTRLGFLISKKGKDFLVTVPSWRATKDVTAVEDLIEEIARIHGYNQIESVLPTMKIVSGEIDPIQALRQRVGSVLTHGFGAVEVYTYAFASERTLTKLGFALNDHLKLANPLSDERPYVVQSLVPNLLECVVKNQRTQETVLIFEQDRVFLNDRHGEDSGESKAHLPSQPHQLCVAYSTQGECEPFWKIKQIVQTLVKTSGWNEMAIRRADTHKPWQHSQRHAELLVGNIVVGELYEVDPAQAEGVGLDHPTAIGEIHLDRLSALPIPPVTYHPVSMYPSVLRDLAFVIANKTEYGTLEKAIKENNSAIVSVDLFDTYHGKGIDPGKKSLAVRVEFRAADRTLESKEVDVWIDEIKKMLETEFGGIMR